MARYKKKLARKLQHDRFRDTTLSLFDRLGDKLEGRGRTILYGIAGVILIAVITGVWIAWSRRKADEARRALGRAITIASAPLAATPGADPTGPTFNSEQERARRAIEEFEKVAAKYGDPYHTEAKFFIASHRLSLEREKAISEFEELSKSSNKDVATLAKFAMAQAKEGDGRLDEAANLYRELAAQNSVIVTPETANLRLALVYAKQGNKKDAADLLFQIVDTARKAKDSDGTALPQSEAAREAALELQKIDPDRFTQLPPEAPRGGITF